MLSVMDCITSSNPVQEVLSLANMNHPGRLFLSSVEKWGKSNFIFILVRIIQNDNFARQRFRIKFVLINTINLSNEFLL